MENIQKKLIELQQSAKCAKNIMNSFGNFKYRSAERIIEAIKPDLKKLNCSIILTDHPELLGTKVYSIAEAILSSPDCDSTISCSGFAREAETKTKMDEGQMSGTASSYSRKYALGGLLLLDDNKDQDAGDVEKDSEGNERKKQVEKITAQAMTQEEVTAVWASNTDLQSIPWFSVLLNDRAAAIKATKN